MSDYPADNLNGFPGEDMPEGHSEPLTLEQEDRIRELFRQWAVESGLIERCAEDE